MSRKSDKETMDKAILEAKESIKKMIDDMSNEEFLEFNMLLLDFIEDDDYWEDDDDDEFDDDFDDDYDDDDEEYDDDNNNIFDFPVPNDDFPF